MVVSCIEEAYGCMEACSRTMRDRPLGLGGIDCITQSVIQDRSYDSYVSTYLICSLTSGFSDLSDSDVKSAMHRDFLNYFNLKDNRLE